MLYNLDIRDEEFWYLKAQKKEIVRQIQAIRAARMAMSNAQSFDDEATIISWELRKLEAYERGEGE